jgi:hypothetical protein
MRARSALTASLLFAALVMVSACSRSAPVYNVQNDPIPVATQRLPLDEIGRTIIQAGTRRHWRMDPTGPGHITGKFDDREHEAVIDISYTQQAYSITLAQSANLHQDGDDIHKKYNKWIRALQREIDERLYSAGLASK